MTSIFSLLASAVFFMALCFSVLQVKRWGKRWPIAYVLVSLILVIPIGHWLMVEFVRGYVSDLSMATIFICAVYLWKVVRPSAAKVHTSLHWFIIIVGIFLFPMSMGLTQFDPFAMGYSGNDFYNLLVVIVATVGMLAWFMRWHHIAIVSMLAIVANGFQIYESQNLWVYLIDPIAVIMCLVSILFKGMSIVMSRYKTLDIKNV